MVYYLAKKLHIRPNEILDEWCMAETLVAWGIYINMDVKEAYEHYKNRPAKERGKQNPLECKVYFKSFDEINNYFQEGING